MKIKNNEKLKKGIVMGVIISSVALIGILGGSSYSKYFTKIDGTGNAVVAKWSFKANNQTKTMENIKLTKAYDQNKILTNTIAPGTSGSFDIVLDATGADVAIDYAVTFNNLVEKPKNLKFSYGTTSGSSLKDLENALKGRIGLNDPRTKTLTINWNWDYETGTGSAISANDEQDTLDAGKNFTFDITITGTQVNPSTSG